jgi:hypothetical protein
MCLQYRRLRGWQISGAHATVLDFAHETANDRTMSLRKKLAELDLVPVLLAVAAIELTLNRLAVPVLRPPGGPVPAWHRDLDTVGLFAFHLATVLGLVVGIGKTLDLFARPGRFAPLPRALVVAGATLFYGLAAWGVFLPAPPTLSFHLESCFTLLLLLLGMALAMRPGDALVKLALVILTVPFLLHYYGTFALRMIVGEARGSSLPDRMRDVGQWSVAIAAIGVAICLAERPIWRALLRPGPLAIAGFVGTILTVVMVRHQDVGLELASKGLGIDFGPGAPPAMVATFVLAAVAITWAIASSLTAETPARRQLGMGLALVCVGGYAFAWPLTLLTVVAGALAIVQAGSELGVAPPPARADVIPEASWRAYVEAVGAELGGSVTHAAGASLVRGVRDGVPYDLRLARATSPILEVTFGAVPAGDPGLTLLSRPSGLLSGRSLAHPPPTSAPVVRTGDHAFDLRFRVHDGCGLTTRLFDEGLRARAAAVLDGWIAVWPGAAIRYHVEPGHGGPLDHPLPLSDLRAGRPAATERLVRVFQLCAELAVRAMSA